MLGKVTSLPMADPHAPTQHRHTLTASLSDWRVSAAKHIEANPTFANDAMGTSLVRETSLAALERAAVQEFRARGFSLARVDSIVVHPARRTADLFIDEGTIARVRLRSMGDVNAASDL